MSSRARAVAFALGALGCAGISAALAGGATPAKDAFGDLRPVLVTSAAFERGEPIGRPPGDGLETRRVPASFAPPDALGAVAEAAGRRLAVALPRGSYVTASHLAPARGPGRRLRGPPAGTTPVEITVTGAGALAARRAGPGTFVDVVVSGSGGPGPVRRRTYVAARGVPLLALDRAPRETGLGADRWTATLALDRAAALDLIRAQSAARELRLLAR